MTPHTTTRPYTGNPSQVLVEQLAALGVRYVFNNTGSHEAPLFDALYGNPAIHGILGLHEGVVTGMAGGYTQVNKDPAVMVAHLDCGLGQSLGQMINIYNAKLPVVTITYAADTGSAIDKRGWGHHIDHSFGPTYISAPYVKASWSVIETGGIAHAAYRALLTALTPPAGPVHLAIYEDALSLEPSDATIATGLPELRAGYPADADVELILQALRAAARPLLFVGDGVWKSGAVELLNRFAERVGARINEGDQFPRYVQTNHPLGCQDPAALDPDLVVALGIRQHSFARSQATYRRFPHARVIAVGADVENLTNFEGLAHAIVADEARTLERLLAALDASGEGDAPFAERRGQALAAAAAEHQRRLHVFRNERPQAESVRPWVLADEIHGALESIGGGLVSMENFVLRGCLGGLQPAGRTVYLPQAGGSEGYGMGAAIGVKLAAPDTPVIGLVGDGSVYYGDTAFWTAAHHHVPVLYVIPNNGGYGIVTNTFTGKLGGGAMGTAGEWAGVVLDKIDLVGVAEAYGVEGREIHEERELQVALDYGLKVVEQEGRPFVLNVRLPGVLPAGQRPAAPFRLRD